MIIEAVIVLGAVFIYVIAGATLGLVAFWRGPAPCGCLHPRKAIRVDELRRRLRCSSPEDGHPGPGRAA